MAKTFQEYVALATQLRDSGFATTSEWEAV